MGKRKAPPKTPYSSNDPRSRITTPLDSQMTLFPAMRQETDRAAGVLAAAYLERYLADLFRVRLRKDVDESMFQYRGPLGDFSGKINLAHALGWISSDVKNDLHVLRDIRNDFAHDPSHQLTFNDPSISDRTLNFVAYRKWKGMYRALPSKTPRGTIEAMQTARGRFEVAVAELIVAIIEVTGHGVLLDELPCENIEETRPRMGIYGTDY
jgi:DNA-binding MltR family transcriptional regulator